MRTNDFSDDIRNQEMSCEFVGITCPLDKERLRNLTLIITYDSFKLKSVFPETHFLKFLTGCERLQRKLKYTMESIFRYPKEKNYQNKPNENKQYQTHTVEDICILTVNLMALLVSVSFIVLTQMPAFDILSELFRDPSYQLAC